MKQDIENFIKQNFNMKSFCGYHYVVACVKNDFISIVLAREEPKYDDGWLFEGKILEYETNIESNVKDEINECEYKWNKKEFVNG